MVRTNGQRGCRIGGDDRLLRFNKPVIGPVRTEIGMIGQGVSGISPHSIEGEVGFQISQAFPHLISRVWLSSIICESPSLEGFAIEGSFQCGLSVDNGRFAVDRTDGIVVGHFVFGSCFVVNLAHIVGLRGQAKNTSVGIILHP